MPKVKEMTNHPCHLLSLPSAKRFWCRHCMAVFEDAITRWRHSRTCRYGVVNNFMKRRELEAKALQNTTVLNPVEARVEQSIQMADLATGTRTVQVKDENGVEILSTPEDFTCFICHKKFQSMEEMRHHVKYPCNASRIVTSRVPHPKHSVPVFIESVPPRHSWDQTQGVEIQQPVTSYVQEQNYQTEQHVLEQHLQAGGSVEVRMQDPAAEQSYTTSSVSYDTVSRAGTSTAPADQEDQKNLNPTTIYVNEKGETVIEVENLDLSADSGELSLAHLLTQLSQQGIVFDKSRSSSLGAQDFVLETRREHHPPQTYEVGGQDHVQHDPQVKSETLAVASNTGDEEEGQPTAEDAANTLAQLAGFRGYIQKQQQSETVTESMVEQTQDHQAVEYIQLSDNGTADAGTSSVSEAGAVQAYQYASPVTIQYTYPSSNSMAVVSRQVQQQDQAQGHHIVGAQHMTLQEVLTADSSTQLYIQSEPEAEDEADIEHGRMESVRYVVDPVTGHQVMQQIDDGGSFDQEDCVGQEHYASTEQSEEVGHDFSQESGSEQHHGHGHQQNAGPRSLIVTSEPEASQYSMEVNNSAASEEVTTVTVASAEQLVHMETDHDTADGQADNSDFTNNSRSEDNLRVPTGSLQGTTNDSEIVDDSSHSQPTSTDLDSSKVGEMGLTSSNLPMTLPQSVTVSDPHTAIETQQKDSQLTNNATAAMIELASGFHDPPNVDHPPACEGAITQTDSECVNNELQTTVSVVEHSTYLQHDSHGQGLQEHYEVVACHDLEEDIPALPVGAVPVSEAGLATSIYAEQSSQAELGNDSYNDHSSEIKPQPEVQAIIEPQSDRETEDGPRYNVETVGTEAAHFVTEPHSVIEAGTAKSVAIQAIGAEEQELVEFAGSQPQPTEISAMFVVTPSGIQPVSRHNP
ncbi:hypothetical protein ElyMa_004143800 [Elysia marginata]|uniref:C2H2-type domain-containing protein n=1 Tax=Elysia marginata TaxID=1093978 RepID=A0AAV4GF63_9GAST|nr:hypothetical protein ElyMa_004143800 [Elysia marginata]